MSTVDFLYEIFAKYELFVGVMISKTHMIRPTCAVIHVYIS
jgi:hypothetical protein